MSREVKLLIDVLDGSLLVSPGLLRYGNDVAQRNGSTFRQFSSRSWIDLNRHLVSGYLSRYYLYANAADRPGSADDLPSPSVTRIQIWRPAGGSQSPDRPRYTLMWQRRVLLNTTRHGLLCTVSLVRVKQWRIQDCPRGVRFRQGHRDAEVVDGNMAVSYTHLTLPTIYSV